MKRLFIIVMLAIPEVLLAQTKEKIILPLDSNTKLVTYQEVVNISGVAKDELYTRAREWFAKTYNSAHDVIQMDDKSSGKIIGKGSYNGYYTMMLTPVPYNLNYTISVTSKDNKYRYEISNFSVKYRAGNSSTLEDYNAIYIKNKGSGSGIMKKLIPHLDLEIRSLAENLKNYMLHSASGIKSKDDF